MVLDGRLSAEEMALTLDYIRTLVRVNIPLDVGLARLGKEADSRRVRQLALAMEQHIRGGASLSEALGRENKYFSPMVLALLEAGDKSGNLGGILEFASRHFRSSLRLSNSFQQALLYPKIVLTFLLVAIIPVCVFAADKISGIYRELPDPPLITRLVIPVVTFISSNPAFVLGAALTACLLILHPVGPLKTIASWLKIKTPYVGALYRATIAASTAKALGLMVRSGLPVVDALSKLSIDPDNQIVVQAFSELSEKLKDGSKLSDHLAEYPIFPRSFSWLVSLGERGENLDEVLLELSEYYEEEAHHRGEIASRMMEPLSLLVLALIVGPIVLSIFAPLVQFVSNME